MIEPSVRAVDKDDGSSDGRKDMTKGADGRLGIRWAVGLRRQC